MPDTNPKTRDARLFRNGRSQAVRIPVEFEFPGEEVTIRQDGARLIIEPKVQQGIPALLALLATMQPLPEGEGLPDIDDDIPEPEDIF